MVSMRTFLLVGKEQGTQQQQQKQKQKTHFER